MRTTIDLPENLFRETKAAAALRGSSMKDLIVEALQKELRGEIRPQAGGTTVQLPLIRMKKGKKVDLTGFDFDDLLT